MLHALPELLCNLLVTMDIMQITIFYTLSIHFCPIIFDDFSSDFESNLWSYSKDILVCILCCTHTHQNVPYQKWWHNEQLSTQYIKDNHIVTHHYSVPSNISSTPLSESPLLNKCIIILLGMITCKCNFLLCLPNRGKGQYKCRQRVVASTSVAVNLQLVRYLNGQCIEMVQHDVIELWQCCIILQTSTNAQNLS